MGTLLAIGVTIYGALLCMALYSIILLIYKEIIIKDIVWPIQAKWKKWRDGPPIPRQRDYIITDASIVPNRINS